MDRLTGMHVYQVYAPARNLGRLTFAQVTVTVHKVLG